MVVTHQGVTQTLQEAHLIQQAPTFALTAIKVISLAHIKIALEILKA